MRSYTDPITGKFVELSDLEFAKVHDETLMKWEQAKAALGAAREAEMSLRRLYVAIASDPMKHKGTETVALGSGYKAKIVKKINYGFIKNADNRVDVDEIISAQNEIEKLGNEGVFLAYRLIKLSPELVVSEYNKLEPDSNPTHKAAKAVIDRVIVTSEGAPTLEIVAPKG